MLLETAKYALQAAVWLGRPQGKAESADHLAEAIHVHRRYLQKVLQGFVKPAFVRSHSGPARWLPARL